MNIKNSTLGMINWNNILPPTNQLHRFQYMMKGHTKLLSAINSFTYSLPLANTLRTIAILPSSLNMLSTIPQMIIDTINNWSTKILEFPINIKQNASAIFLFLIFILLFIYQLCIAPAIQNIYKRKVLCISEFTENKPWENAKQIKTSLEQDFGIVLDIINKIRVINRETPVFRSYHRIFDTIYTLIINL